MSFPIQLDKQTFALAGVLHPIERTPIARFADRIGRIPVVGTLVGIVRMTSSLVCGIFAGLGCFLTWGCGYNRFAEKFYFSILQSGDEFNRGFGELFPTLIDCVDRDRETDERKGKISNSDGAYGRYMYEIPNGCLCYSKKRYEGEPFWIDITSRPRENIYLQTYGQISKKGA